MIIDGIPEPIHVSRRDPDATRYAIAERIARNAIKLAVGNPALRRIDERVPTCYEQEIAEILRRAADEVQL